MSLTRPPPDSLGNLYGCWCCSFGFTQKDCPANCCSLAFSGVKWGVFNRNTPIWTRSALPPQLVGHLHFAAVTGTGDQVGPLRRAVANAIRHPSCAPFLLWESHIPPRVGNGADGAEEYGAGNVIQVTGRHLLSCPSLFKLLGCWCGVGCPFLPALREALKDCTELGTYTSLHTHTIVGVCVCLSTAVLWEQTAQEALPGLWAESESKLGEN